MIGDTSLQSATNAHNLVANILAWTGLAGISLFTLFAVSSIVSIIKNKDRTHENQYLVCLVICVFIQSLLDQAILDNMCNPATYFFLLSFGFLTFGTKIIESN